MASKIVPSSFRALARCSSTASFQQSRALANAPSRILAATTSRQNTTSLNIIRFAHSIPRPAANLKAPSEEDSRVNTNIAPSYELTFTCVPCGTRSAHNVSKQGYHHGSVLITCPSCRNRHVISDHLGIFGKNNLTVEDLLRDKGVLVKRGTLGEDGDLEFWEDGSTTVRSERQGEAEGQDPKPKPKGTGQDNPDAPGSTFGQA